MTFPVLPTWPFPSYEQTGRFEAKEAGEAKSESGSAVSRRPSVLYVRAAEDGELLEKTVKETPKDEAVKVARALVSKMQQEHKADKRSK